MRPAKPEGHLAAVTCVGFSPDGREIVSGSEDRTLLVWDVESGKVVQRLEGHSGFVGTKACAFLPDGRRIVSGGWGGEVFVWDRATGRRLAALSELRRADDVYSLAVRPDGREVMVGGHNGRVTAWDLVTGEKTFDNEDLRHPPQEIVWTVGYLDDGRRFGGGQAGKVLIWGKGAPREIALEPSSGLPLSGGRILVGGWEGLHIVDADRKIRRIASQEGWIYGLALSPRQDVAVAGDDAGNTRVWNLATGAMRCELPKAAGISVAAFDPSGARFAVAGEDATVVIARASDCGIVRRMQADRGRVGRVAAGTAVLVGDGAGNVSTWEAGVFRASHVTPTHAGQVTALAALADGRWVSGGADRTIFLSSSDAKHKLGILRKTPYAILPLPGEASVLTVDKSGDVNIIPVDGTGPKQIFSTGGASLYAAAIRPLRHPLK
jgi:WD40 repeat protein